MGHVLVALEQLDQRLQAGRRHPLVGPGSLHASLIEGGQEYSSYPERCLLTGERRTLPGETVGDVERELRALVDGTDATAHITFAREPFQIDPSHGLPRQVARAAGESGFFGIAFWTDAALLGEGGLTRVPY